MREGITTGSCAALAAKAALALLVRNQRPAEAEIPLPDGSRLRWTVTGLRRGDDWAEAAVVKDAGDDPDITNGARVLVRVSRNGSGQVRFLAGEGVGTVTLPGLALPPGEPAINPGPRAMIAAALAEIQQGGVDVRVSIPGGRELAQKTFNPRLGVVGGLSILGSSGRVRPFSADALQLSLRCAFEVAAGLGIRLPVLVPGHLGRRAAQSRFRLREQQLVEVSNEWGFMLDLFGRYPFDGLLAVGHPGKLAKLAFGAWQTHSSQSAPAAPYVATQIERILGRPVAEAVTVEGLLMGLPQQERTKVATRLAQQVRRAVSGRIVAQPLAVLLINLQGETLGHAGDLSPWS